MQPIIQFDNFSTKLWNWFLLHKKDHAFTLTHVNGCLQYNDFLDTACLENSKYLIRIFCWKYKIAWLYYYGKNLNTRNKALEQNMLSQLTTHASDNVIFPQNECKMICWVSHPIFLLLFYHSQNIQINIMTKIFIFFRLNYICYSFCIYYIFNRM